MHEVIWTDALLDEWEEVIVDDHRRSAESAASVTAAIRAFFPESKVERDDYQHLIGEMSGADPDDHEHMAAAVAGGAAAILTRNRKHFPEEPLAERGVRVMDPDDYLCELTHEVPDEVAATVVRLAAEKQRPPKTPADLLDSLQHAGVPSFRRRCGSFLRRSPAEDARREDGRRAASTASPFVTHRGRRPVVGVAIHSEAMPFRGLILETSAGLRVWPFQGQTSALVDRW